MPGAVCSCARKIESKLPAVALPPTLGQEPTCPSGVLLLTGSQADYVLITPAEEREGEWEGSSRLPPQAWRLPRPQHCTNESRGSGWAHMGGQGLLPRAKRSQRKRPEERRQGDTSRDSCSKPGLLPSFCMHVLNLTLLFCFDDGHACTEIFVRILYFICTSVMHNVC